jgi:hypothetical protein
LLGGFSSNEIWEFTISSQKFKFLAKMKSERQFHSSVVIDECLYIIGGIDNSQNKYLSHCEIFDYQKNFLDTKIKDLNIPRANSGVCASVDKK